MKSSLAFYKKYYGSMKGFTVTAAGAKAEAGEVWPTFTLEGKDSNGKKITYNVEVSQDEEGNGPGFLFGLPVPGEG